MKSLRETFVVCLLLASAVSAQTAHHTFGRGSGTGSWKMGHDATVAPPPSPGTGPHNEYTNTDGTPLVSLPLYDGPAHMPTQYYYTAISGTPSPGATLTAITAAGLQAAYNAAPCGVTIPVIAGTSYTGTITLGPKNCDDAHYITIKSTGVADATFPPEGTRLTPCQAGLATFANRPAYDCPTPKQLLAQFLAPNSGQAFVITGDHIRMIGLEPTRLSTPIVVWNIIELQGTANHIIIDRSWVHGISGDGLFPMPNASDTSTSRGVALGQSNHVAVIDSYLTDFYNNGSGTIGSTLYGAKNGNTDAQCISGGDGPTANTAWGVYKIVNNHCEGAAEAIMLGGGPGPALTPVGCTVMVNCNPDTVTNVEVRLNYFFKPLTWNGNTTSPNTIGWPAVKNGFEMKTCNNCLFDGNVVENVWYHSQVGYFFSVAPVNQQGGTPPGPTCPTCSIRDVVYRYNYEYNGAYGIAVYAFAPGGCPTCLSQGADRVSIHDNVIGDKQNLGTLSLTSTGDGLELMAVPDPTGQGLSQVNNLSIRHNTWVRVKRDTAFLQLGSGQAHNWTIQDNIWPYGDYGVDYGGGVCDLPYPGNFYAILTNCVSNWTVDHNANFNWLVTSGYHWPTNGTGAGNWFYTGSSPVGFTNFNTGDSSFTPANYALTSGSPLHNAASDGKDVGADISTLVNSIANVKLNATVSTPGNLVIYPSSTTAEQTAVIPFSCQNGASMTCTWSLDAGSVGSISAAGIYTAPNTVGTAVVRAVNGTNTTTAALTVSGTIPTATGDCATGYTHRGAYTVNKNDCHMTHTETVGTLSRRWEVRIPTRYIAGTSGAIVVIDSNHGLDSTDPCAAPSNEEAGWGPYIDSVPSPAPVLICPEGPWDSTQTNDKWNYIGRNAVTYYGSATPNDPDFIRQIILLTVRDLQLNPKKVFVASQFPAQGYATNMAAQAAAANSDLVAGVATANDSVLTNLDATFTVGRPSAPYYGQTLPYPAQPMSALMLPGLYVQQASVYAQICGNNQPASNGYYHPLTVDDSFRYWDHANQSTTNTYQPNNVGTSFCLGTYDGSGNGLASTLEVRKSTGGKLNTAIVAYKFVGNGKATPWCSYAWDGSDTLGCGLNSSTAAIDLRNSTCDWTKPCNHYLDAGTGPASASGYSQLDIEYKFFLAHPKP